MQKVAKSLIRKHGLFDSFYIADLSVLKCKIDEWRKHLPMVHPHYAVKCNPNKEMLKMMINEGLGFDCASKSEIQTVLKLGGKPEHLIFAHPVKAIEDLKYAVSKGVKYTTFDSISELEKLRLYAPKMKCVMRLKVDNPTARVQLGLKYGVSKEEYKDLIDAAKSLKLDIVGASFHVGSASTEPAIFESGISYCHEVLEYARQRGYVPNILDVGGGFTKDSFIDCACVIRESIKKYGFDKEDYKILSEPGRLFSQEVMTFFVNVIGQRTREGVPEYWISDGLYGSFNCILYDGQKPTFEVLRHPLLKNEYSDNTKHESVIFGQTCDSADRIGRVNVPYLRNGDYLMIPNFGAYTVAGGCNFNGINMMNPKIFYINM